MAKKKRGTRVLIVGLGSTGLPDREIGRAVDLRQVFRATTLLHRFRDVHVTWLTSPPAVPLLADNPLVERVVVETPTTREALEALPFDVVVNLDDDPDLARWAASIDAACHRGHRPTNGADAARLPAGLAWWERLDALVGGTDGPPAAAGFVLGPRPAGGPVHDVALDEVPAGSGWPRSSWDRLAEALGPVRSITRQAPLHDIPGRLEWIHSARVLVAVDGLSVDLALALGRPVVALTPRGADRLLDPAGRAVVLEGAPDLTSIQPHLVARAVLRILSDERHQAAVA